MLKKDSQMVLQNINMIARQLFLLFKKSTTFWDNPRILTKLTAKRVSLSRGLNVKNFYNGFVKYKKNY